MSHHWVLQIHNIGIFIPLHISSSGFFNPQHIWDLYPTAYFKLRVPQPATYLGSFSHCIFSSQGSLTRNIFGILIPLHLLSSGFFNPQHIWDLYPTAHLITGFFNPQHIKGSIPLHIMGSQSHCIALHIRDLYPTAYLISRTLLPPLCISEILIPLHCISVIFIPHHLHPTSYHGVSIPLHCISRSLSQHHTSSQGLHPFHITRSLSRCIS